jgi:hypothetical protein
MSVRFSMSVAGAQRLRAKMSNRVNFLGGDGVRKVLKTEGKALLAAFRQHANNLSPGDVPDLSESYKPQKRRAVGFIYPILRRTGEMLGSMYTNVIRDNGWVIRVGFAGQHAGGGSNADIARAHIEGRGRLPKRDFTKLPPGFSARVRAHLVEALWGK